MKRGKGPSLFSKALPLLCSFSWFVQSIFFFFCASASVYLCLCIARQLFVFLPKRTMLSLHQYIVSVLLDFLLLLDFFRIWKQLISLLATMIVFPCNIMILLLITHLLLSKLTYNYLDSSILYIWYSHVIMTFAHLFGK